MKKLGSESGGLINQLERWRNGQGSVRYGQLATTQVWLANFGEGGVVFEDQQSLVAYASKQLDADSVVLVKGSRGSRMECVVFAAQRREV